MTMAPNPPQTAQHAASNAAYMARTIDALRDRAATRKALQTATGMGSTQLQDVLTHLVSTGSVSQSSIPTRGRPAYVYELVREPEDTSSVAIRRYTHAHADRVKPDDESHEFEGTSGTFALYTVPSTAAVPCAREPRTVALAACLDGYVNATATGRKSPCNQCPTGRARRADYAGADFEESDDE